MTIHMQKYQEKESNTHNRLILPQNDAIPKRKIGLRAEKQSIHQEIIQDETITHEDMDKKKLCIDVLVEGNVQSFVDLFYLTHRTNPKSNDIEHQDLNITTREMLHLKHNLVTSEQARRMGETAKVCECYDNLAKYFEDIGDFKTAIFFYEKCLEISRLTMDEESEMRALHNLGGTHYAIEEFETSCNYHQLQAQIAQNLENMIEKKKAHNQLAKVYMDAAKQYEVENDSEKAISYYLKCVESSRIVNEMNIVGLAQYKIGCVYLHINKPSDALSYLKEYNSHCKEIGDIEGETSSNTELGKAYQLLNDSNNALKCLQICLELSMKTNNLVAQAESCKYLGIIYNARGDYKKAIEFFEKHFELCRSLIGTGQLPISWLDSARVNLGTARGNQKMMPYLTLIQADLDALLGWKNRRVKF